jgi:hypothetical protein
VVEQGQAEEPGGGLRDQLVEALRECARLREENARLRRSLGLPADPIQVPLEAAPSLFPTVEPLPVVEARSATADKIALFRTLFRGREDVYPVLWVSERTGKKGYAPARRPTPGGSGGRMRKAGGAARDAWGRGSCGKQW